MMFNQAPQQESDDQLFGVAKRHRYRSGYRGRFGDSVIRCRYRSGYRGRFGDSVIAHTGTREKFSRMGMVATDVFFALEQWG